MEFWIGQFSFEGGATMGAFQRLGKNPFEPPEMRIKKAVETLKARGVENDKCPRCNVFDWNADLLDIPATSALAKSPYSPKLFEYTTTSTLSVLSLVCKNCGYSIFHTLNVLGL